MTPRSILSSSRWHYSVILDQRKIQCTLKYLQIHRGRTQNESGDPDAKRIYQANANPEVSDKKRVFIRTGLRELSFLVNTILRVLVLYFAFGVPHFLRSDLFEFDQARTRSRSRVPSRLVACTPPLPCIRAPAIIFVGFIERHRTALDSSHGRGSPARRYLCSSDRVLLVSRPRYIRVGNAFENSTPRQGEREDFRRSWLGKLPGENERSFSPSFISLRVYERLL